MTRVRERYATDGAAARWDYWTRLEWRFGVDEVSAMTHLEGFGNDLRRESPGIRILAGWHSYPQPHAHVLLRLSRRLRARLLNAEEVRYWLLLRWTRGPVWCVPFDRSRFEQDHRHGGGAIRYLVRDPASVVTT